MKNNKGFSLVELIVVIAIMAILAAVAIPTFAGFITKANKGADADFLAQTEYAITLANTANPEFDLVALTVVVDDKGDFSEIKYEYKLGDQTKTDGSIKESGNAADADKDAQLAIDWGYTFKAYKGHTVKFTVADNKVDATKN